MRTLSCALLAIALTFAAGAARADEGGSDAGFSLALTLGERVFFLDGDTYRGPFSLEAVPSFGWTWFKFDLGLYATLESVRIEGWNVGHWNFTFRPGGRLTPPMLPLYFRFALPLQIQKHDLDFGVMLGAGLDFRVAGILGIILEVDTAMTRDLRWGGDGIPLEFRAGISLNF
jgi:hypothetical protein